MQVVQWIEDNLTYGTPDWMFYDFGLTATWNIFAFDVRYTATDLDRNECFGGTNVCGNAVVWNAGAFHRMNNAFIFKYYFFTASFNDPNRGSHT